jgi:hypothetical protein
MANVHVNLVVLSTELCKDASLTLSDPVRCPAPLQVAQLAEHHDEFMRRHAIRVETEVVDRAMTVLTVRHTGR